MKFMKLGSKPDSFQTDGDNTRYVATELATDIVVNVGTVKFYLHKFPLLSKSLRLQKLVSGTGDDGADEVDIHDIPGGPAAFEICAKFCYGMTVTLNAYNVVAARCASEYLEMFEAVDKGNLVYKIDVFLNSSIFRSWKDSIIVLQTTRSLLPWAEELKIVGHCLDSIASKASMDTSRVEWSYTYNRKKLPAENGSDPVWNGPRKAPAVPRDWWVEDLCELHLDLYKRVLTTIRARGQVPGDVIGEALNAYALRRIPGFGKGAAQAGEPGKSRPVLEAIIRLLPSEKGSVSCGFLMRLLGAATALECGEAERREVARRAARQLDEATVSDLLIRAPPGEPTVYDVDAVRRLVEDFAAREPAADALLDSEFHEIRSPSFAPDASRVAVAKLVDGYLAEIARDPGLPLSKFASLAEAVSGFPRPSHDGIYRAVDMFLKEHPGIGKSERKRVCRLMDCRKLSAEACMHAVQNERLPLRVVVQVLFFEQIRASTAAGNGTPELPGSIRALVPGGGSHGSSRSTTEEDWDSVPTAEDIKALKGELATLRVGADPAKADRADRTGKKGLVVPKRIFSKLWSGKERGSGGEISSSETSESPGSTNAEETKSTPSARSGRLSAS